MTVTDGKRPAAPEGSHSGSGYRGRSKLAIPTDRPTAAGFAHHVPTPVPLSTRAASVHTQGLRPLSHAMREQESAAENTEVLR